MLQRIQSLFLVLASASMLIAVAVPLAFFYFNSDKVMFEAMGVYINDMLNDSTWGLFFIGIVSSVLALITIFFYKKRILQIRLSIFNIILMVGFYLYSGYIFYNLTSVEGLVFNKIGFGAVTPLIGIILTILAIRKIGEDEALVQSLNRLRG